MNIKFAFGYMLFIAESKMMWALPVTENGMSNGGVFCCIEK